MFLSAFNLANIYEGGVQLEVWPRCLLQCDGVVESVAIAETGDLEKVREVAKFQRWGVL